MPPIMHDMKEALCVVQTSLAASEPDAWHGVGHACAVRKQGSPARALKNISYAIQATATHTISASVLVNRLPRRARPAPCQQLEQIWQPQEARGVCVGRAPDIRSGPQNHALR